MPAAVNVPPSPSPYAEAPIPVAHAFVAGSVARSVADCPYDRAVTPNEYDAWHRGHRVARMIGDGN